MNSQVLQEGILDVKVPRGNEERKIWKVWRRQWIRFSAEQPHRSDPYLILELSYSSAETPGNRIRISRDGLRLFRCRSNSRPYRTWAVMSGNRVVLFFASDNETCAQEWMQAVRDGLWPPCFSFQMIAAYAHELSLIDDEKTFVSGALGAYGRFVLTSEDVISLVHPHWGATQLQISLFNIQDIILVRKSESSSAGVLSIILNGSDDSKSKNLQFYCKTVMDAIQWISSKMFAKILHESRNFPEMEQPKSNPNDAISPGTSIHHASGHFNSDTVQPLEDSDDSFTGFVDTNIVYENLKCTERGGNFSSEVIHCDTLVIMNNQDISEKLSADTLTKDEPSVDISQQLPLSGTTIFDSYKGSLYEDVSYERVSKPNTSNLPRDDVDKFYNPETSSLHANTKILKNSYYQKANESTEKCTTDVINIPKYSVVNKRHSTDSTVDRNRNECLGTQQLNNTAGDMAKISKHLSNFENSKNITHQDILDSRAENLKKFSEIQLDSFPFDYTYDAVNSATYSVANKRNAINYSLENIRCLYSPVTDTSTKEHISKNPEINRIRPLPSIPDSFLDTRINPTIESNKDIRAIESFEDDYETLPRSEANNCDDEEFINHVYEYLAERKGTVYEEIDDSDDDCQSTPNLPPKLPNRPTNLQIPNTLRLQKLSQSITEALKEMETTPSPTTNYSLPNFIKKVTDISRVMNVSPKPESNSAKTYHMHARNELPLLPSNR